MRDRYKILFFLTGTRGWSGGKEYFHNFIVALQASIPDQCSLEICVFTDEALPESLQEIVSKVYTKKDYHPVTLVDRIKWRLNSILSNDNKPHIDSFLRKEKFDFVFPYNNIDVRVKPYKSASWIPDFQNKCLPEYFESKELESRERKITNIEKYSDKVILSSKSAEADCHKYYPGTIGKTSVVSFRSFPQKKWYLGDPSEIQLKYNLPEKFFLISNQFWKHKNHILVFRALQLLKKESKLPVIVFTGSIFDYRNPMFSDEILSQMHERGVSDQIKLLGFIPKDDQIQLMRRSIAVIQPSLFEGWSTIVENARCFGKPVILSNLPVHIEQDVPVKQYFKRDSVEELAECISTYWDSLSPGPDMEKEQCSLETQHDLMKYFGKSILDIIQS